MARVEWQAMLHKHAPATSILQLLIAAACTCSAAHADPLPPAIRACAAEADALKRLECYDRAVAAAAAVNPPAPLATTAAPATPPAAVTAPAAAAPAMAAPAVAAPAATLSGAIAANPPAPAASPPPAAAPPAPANHFSARVSKVDRYGGEVTVHLDNGQVWQQIYPTDPDLRLHPGDAVTMDLQLGSWWLSKGKAALQVRLQH